MAGIENGNFVFFPLLLANFVSVAKKIGYMDTNTANPTKLSNLQIELLKLYAHKVSDDELMDIKKMLAEYFARKVDEEMDQLWEKNGWNESKVEEWKKEHARVSSRK